MKVKLKDYIKFLHESNKIEGEYSMEAVEDAKKAWEYAKKNWKNLSVDYVLEIHRLLMQNLNPRIAGKIRECAVYIGGRKCENEGVDKISKSLEELFEIMKTFDFVEDAYKSTHLKFEDIHPFEDGNGRVGRILMNVYRINIGLPILIIYEGLKMEYYKWFGNERIEETLGDGK